MHKITTYYLLLLSIFYFYLSIFFKKLMNTITGVIGNMVDTNLLPSVTQLMLEYSQLPFLILCIITIFFSFVSFFTNFWQKKFMHIIVFILFLSIILLIVYFISLYFFNQLIIHNLQTCQLQNKI